MPENIDIQELAKSISQYFNLSEVRELCFNLIIEFENIEGTTLKIKSIEFVKYCQRHNRLPSLLKELKRIRPDVPWPEETGIDESQTINLPYIILAMTRNEADDLIGSGDKEAVQNLQKTLGNNISFSAWYGEKRSDWVPYAPEQDRNINEIIEDVTSLIYEAGEYEGTGGVNLVDFSPSFFHEDVDTRMQAWDLLTKLKNCIVIIDSISLFHPDLISYLQKSHISSEAAMIFLSPIHSHFVDINRLIEAELKSELWLALKRFEDLEMNYEIGVNDLRNLKKWLKTILPKSVEKMQGNKPNWLSNQKIKNLISKKEQGINQTFRGVS
ncbi:MAG: hypothetical protein GY943_01000 [Chloroflexi bacterium]|nr:hypothetical protein [Chloroflexota bacterium]